MHAAGRSLEEIGDYVGHSSAYITDRYRHLIEGARTEAADALDAYPRAEPLAVEGSRLRQAETNVCAGYTSGFASMPNSLTIGARVSPKR